MHRSSSRAPGCREAGPRLGLLLAIALLCGAAPRAATALAISDLTPLYFGGGGGFGFRESDLIASGLVPGVRASSQHTWLATGPVSLGLPVSVDQRLTRIHANPRPRGAPPRSPSP